MYLIKRILILVYLLSAVYGFSQNRNIDSLRNLLFREKTDSLKAKLFYKISGAYLNRGLSDSCELYARKCFTLSKKINFIRGLAVSSNFLGQAKAHTGLTDSAAYFFNEAKTYYHQLKDASREAGMLNNTGIVYRDQGKISKALECYFSSLKIVEQLHDSESIANGCHNIGQLYGDVGDTTNSLKFHTRALAIRKSIGDTSGIGSSLIALGIFHQAHGRPELAKKYFNESLKISEAMGEEESIAIACYNLGNVYYKQNKIDQCRALYEKSLDLSRKNKDFKGVAICLEILADIHLSQNESSKAIPLLKEAYQIEINSTEVLGGLCLKLSDAYEKNHDYTMAFQYLRKSGQLKDSLFNAENIRKLTSEGLKYEYEKEKLLLQKEQEKKEAVAIASAYTKNVIIGVTILVLILISIFSYTIYNKLKENRRQKLTIEEQQREMIASINYAKRIQYALLAHDDLLEKNLPGHFVLFKPKDIVSGDFYWATVKNNFFYIAVCDCTGHGVPGAFMSLLSINFLNEAINEKEIVMPGEILDHVRNRIIENMDGGRDGMDAILLKLPLDKRNGLIAYAAANNSPLLIRNNSSVPLQKDKMPVGLGENLNSFSTFSFEAINGDTIYMYTDGFADQFGGPKGKKFKYKQLDQLILTNAEKTIQEQKEQLYVEFERWKGNLEQVDDICVVGIKFC